MDVATAVDAVAEARSLDARVTLIRKLPQDFGSSQLPTVYAEIAREIYAPSLDPDFAYVHWIPDYQLKSVKVAYENAFEATQGFTNVDAASLSRAMLKKPRSLLAFRLILGLTANEFAVSTGLIGLDEMAKPVSKSKVESTENGKSVDKKVADTFGMTIDSMMRGRILNSPPAGTRRKQDKPDTARGWKTVREFAERGVPLDVFLHQRLYGGAFNQLLNATGKMRGDSLEDAVQAILDDHKIGYLRTGSGNQGQIQAQFEISVRPAPDFVIHDKDNRLRALLECKATNDGGTARDKASRFASLRAEKSRLGGIPVFAVLSGLGWRRVRDALGPVVRDTEGRVFTPSTLPQLVSVQPLSTLAKRGT
ncbi:MAG: hypothetical protein ACHQZQ_04950 [SAR324 cluster bacterium]